MPESHRGWVLWAGLLIGFSPVLHNLIELLWSEPRYRYVLLGPYLMTLLLAFRLGAAQVPQRARLGVALIAIGVAGQTLGIVAGTWLIARLGLPLAMLGLSFFAGRPEPRTVALAFAAVPIPDSVMQATSPQLETALGVAASWVFGLVGIEFDGGGTLFLIGEQRFELMVGDNGMPTALLLAVFGWYSAVRQEAGLRRCAEWALLGGALAIVVQPVSVLLALAWLPLGAPDAGRFLLTYGLALALAAIASVQMLLARSRGRPPAVATGPTG